MYLKELLRRFLYPAVCQNRSGIPSRGEKEPVAGNCDKGQKAPVVMDNMLLAGKNVFITGAGRNIGRSIALEMAKQGANIYFSDIDEQRLRKLEQELSSYKIESRGFVSDISITDDIDALFNALVQNNIEIDILVNNAGFQRDIHIKEDFDLTEWHKTLNTNVIGPIYLTKLLSQMMIENQTPGSIIFITSIHESTILRIPSYSASKAALHILIKELAFELAPHKIRVNGIAPGWVAEDAEGQPLAYGSVPLYGSSMNPCYIGRAAVYLASDYFSRFTTGMVIRIDGGSTLQNIITLNRAFHKGIDEHEVE